MKDIEIIEKCVAGEKEYFGKLYDKYIDKIYKYIYLKTSSKEIAEDITQDVFLSALDKIDTFQIDEQSNVNAWFYRIAHNKAINFYKANKEDENIWDYLDVGIHQDFWQDLDNKNKLQEVLSVLKTVQTEHREIIMLRIWEDLSYKEIAEMTGKSVSNCKKIVSRVLLLISAQFIFFGFLILNLLWKIL